MDFLPDKLNEEMNIFAKFLRQSVKITTTIIARVQVQPVLVYIVFWKTTQNLFGDIKLCSKFMNSIRLLL